MRQAILPMQKPRIEWIKLRELKQAVVTAVSTLYIPPITKQGVSKKYLDLLEMDAQNFKLSNKSHTSSK